ncbi:MAG: CheR family methyltransferase [Alcanivoracaceae bacterium]
MAITADNFDYLRALMLERAAIGLEPDKQYLAEARLARLANRCSGGDVNQLIAQCRGGGLDLRRELVEAMAINETFFFRDPLLEQCLTETVLPALIERRQGVRVLRIWCAACSTGQEAYSVAMILREHFPALADWTLEFIASDFSRPALRQAEQGLYAINEVNRGLPAKRLMSWFSQQGLAWQVKPELRQMIRFREINLVGLWPETARFDLILIRNVMIYFSAETRRLLLSRLRGQMAADGYLMLGAAETLDKTGDFKATGPNHRPCYQPATRRTG